MAYIDRAYYTALYGDIPESDFNRLSWEACRALDNHTTGVDGVKKLATAFPTDEYQAEAVKRCACKLVSLLHQIETAEKAAAEGRGYQETANGLRGKVIASITSGAESVSYATGSRSEKAATTVIDKAAADQAEKNRLIRETVRAYLSGIGDANGVRLLYMGVYPHV